nr:isoamylase 2, chloroplastic [Ipomoea batatas]
MSLADSQGVGTSYKQSAVDLDFELRLASFYLSLFLKSELGYEVNNSEIKSHKKSICICESAGIAASPSEEFPTSVVKKEGTHEVICVAYELVRRRRTVPEKPIDDPRVDLIAYVAGEAEEHRHREHLDLVLELSLLAKLKVVAVVVKSLIDDLSRIGTVLNTSEQNIMLIILGCHLTNQDLWFKYSSNVSFGCNGI